jgi:8-oxo-dGTP diphosphatase
MNINLRNAILNQITGITALDAREQADIADAVEWIQSGADLFRIKKPDIPPKHLVSYLVLVDEVQKSILLVDHIKAQLWLPTGGHVLPDERPEDAVTREANEELNIQASFFRGNRQPFFITVSETVGLTPGHTDVSLWYLLRANKHDFIRYDKDEFTDIEWFTFDEILGMDPVIFDRHIHRFTKKLIAHLDK